MLRAAFALTTLLPSLASARDGPATRALRARHDRALALVVGDATTEAERVERETAITAIVRDSSTSTPWRDSVRSFVE